ncbi:MAG: cation diffusion facilitator family transporter [Actinomycetota bacterium]|nr:cation diffusion facilitator family transporter [Actinomycetota bacterium]
MQEGSRKAVVAALLANAGIAVAKFVGFLITRSSSMLAESVHSVADSSNQALLLLGGARARKGPTASHQFGYGRERYFWAFVVALVLFGLGSVFSLFEGYEKLRHEHAVKSPGVAIAILGVAIVLESLSFRLAVREAEHERADESWWAFIRRSKTPEIAVVLLEDLGALVGLVLALVGVFLAALTGEPVWDALGTLAIGALLGVIAVILIIEMRSLLIGESATPEQLERIERAILSGPGVRRLIHMRTQHLGPDELLVGAKIELDSSLSFAEVAEVVNATEQSVRAEVAAARIVYLEPAVAVDTASPAP